MKNIKNKRLRKKLHREIINDLCFYGSQSCEWRTKLFQAKEGERFDFSQEDLYVLLRREHEQMIHKYKFQFSVMVIPKNHACVPLWLQDDFYDAVFKFYAKEFPEVYELSGNCKG